MPPLERPGADAAGPVEHVHDSHEAAGNGSTAETVAAPELVRELLAALGDRYALGELAAAIIEQHGRPVWLAVVRARVDIDRDRAGVPRIGETAAAFRRRRGLERTRAAKGTGPRFLSEHPANGRPTCEWCGDRRKPGETTCKAASCLDLEAEYRLSTGLGG